MGEFLYSEDGDLVDGDAERVCELDELRDEVGRLRERDAEGCRSMHEGIALNEQLERENSEMRIELAALRTALNNANARVNELERAVVLAHEVVAARLRPGCEGMYEAVNALEEEMRHVKHDR